MGAPDILWATMSEYRVNLDIYNGPLDLLLYLIRREEVDIYDIPIARIMEQYVQHVEVLQRLDPNLAGEFLVMAATLMEIKSRMLLPSPPPEEAEQEGVEIDPRAELVRQLLEYKAFKDAAGDLEQAASQQALKFPRGPADVQGAKEAELDLEDAQVWDLLDAFDRMMAAIGQEPGRHEIIYDDTPIELHATDIVDRLQREGSMAFGRIFEGRNNRSEIVGLFLALLELVRQKRVLASQEGSFGEIFVHLNAEGDAQVDSDESETPTPTEAPTPVLQDDQEAHEDPVDGEYIATQGEHPDDAGTEA
jgi:segregation and condensation protein A